MPRTVRPWFRYYTETFADRKILRLRPDERWLWTAILGAARESPEPGYLYIAEGVPMTRVELARYADVSPRMVQPALDTMESLGMVELMGVLIRVPNFSNRQFESDNVTARTQSHRERSKEQAKNVPTCVPTNVLRNTPETETETETEKNNTAATAADDLRPDVEQVCELLAELIESNGSKRPTISSRWRTAARLLIDTDKRTVDQIERAIRWSQADPFYRSIVMSMPKIREHYDAMRLRAAGSTHQPYRDPADQSAYDQAL